jgi:hypothetical protein
MAKLIAGGFDIKLHRKVATAVFAQPSGERETPG